MKISRWHTLSSAYGINTVVNWWLPVLFFFSFLYSWRAWSSPPPVAALFLRLTLVRANLKNVHPSRSRTGGSFGGFRHFSRKINRPCSTVGEIYGATPRSTGINMQSRVVCVFIARDIGGWRPFVSAARERRDFVSGGQGFMGEESNFLMI